MMPIILISVGAILIGAIMVGVTNWETGRLMETLRNQERGVERPESDDEC